MPSLESDLIEILKGTMESEMGLYESGSIKAKLLDDIDKIKVDDALKALNQVNLLDRKGSKKVKDALRNAGRKIFPGPPVNENIRELMWKQWSLETNLASCCFSIVLPNLAIGLCEWCDPANPKKNDRSPESLDGLNYKLFLWAIYNLALAYKDTKGGSDRAEKLLLKIAEPNKDEKIYRDFEKSKDFETARAALQWPSLIQLCEIHKDRQEKTRFEERKGILLGLLDPKLNCNKEENEEECNKVECVLFSTFHQSTSTVLEKYKSYIACSLFLLCQEYQILSMRANCRKKIENKDKANLIKTQGQRVCVFIQYINQDTDVSPLKGLKNRLYLIALMYIHEALQSIDDATSAKKEDFDTIDIEKPWELISNFVSNFEKNTAKADRLFPERFEWWPKIIKIMISTIENDKNNNKINILVEKLTTKDVELRKNWIQDKLEKIGLRDTKRKPSDGYDAVIKAIRNKICDESMKLRDSEDPETDRQIETYMKVVGHFNDRANNILKGWEIELIKAFLGCHLNKNESNKLDRWYMARLCARRRFLEELEENDCYKKNSCDVWKEGSDNSGSESQLHRIIEKLFNKVEPEKEGDIISGRYLDNAIKKTRDDSKERLRYHSRHKKMSKRFGVVCLRRWQSYTPALSAPQKVSRGGGYFVFECDSKGDVKKGVVIDPGLYFLENFIEEGFSIQDIDAVLLTHSHIDHRDDLEAILTLLHETAEIGTPNNIRLVVTPGAWDDIASMIRRSREHIDDIYTVEDEDTKEDNKNIDQEPIKSDKDNGRRIPNIADPIMVKWEKAYHKCFDADCVGYRLWNNKTPGKGFRFTGDTVYPPNGLGITGNDDVVMLNLGGLVSEKPGTNGNPWTLKTISGLNDKKVKEWVLETGFLESHLYLAGALQLLSDWKKSLDKNETGLAILCELPEELSGGHRKIIAKAIENAINNSCIKSCDNPQDTETTPKEYNNEGKKENKDSGKIIVVPEDVGLRISYSTTNLNNTKKNNKREEGPRIECLYCSQHVNPKEIEVIPWGLEERLMFVCKNCRKAAAPYLLEEKFKHYRDRGRPFERAES